MRLMRPYTKENDKVDGLIILQVDDSLGMGTPRFLEEEEEAFKTF